MAAVVRVQRAPFESRLIFFRGSKGGHMSKFEFGAQACLNWNQEKKLPTVMRLRNHLHKETDDSASKRSRRTFEDLEEERWEALRDTATKEMVMRHLLLQISESSVHYSFNLWQPLIGPLRKIESDNWSMLPTEPFNQQEGKRGYGNNSFPGAAAGFFQ